MREGTIGELSRDPRSYHNLDNLTANLNALSIDLKANPSRYVRLSLCLHPAEHVCAKDSKNDQKFIIGDYSRSRERIDRRQGEKIHFTLLRGRSFSDCRLNRAFPPFFKTLVGKM